jgi:hypothetical protein
VDRAELRQKLINYFDDRELRDLCFDLDVDYDCLRGEGKGDKARELMAHLERRGRLSELTRECGRLRPNAVW